MCTPDKSGSLSLHQASPLGNAARLAVEFRIIADHAARPLLIGDRRAPATTALHSV